MTRNKYIDTFISGSLEVTSGISGRTLSYDGEDTDLRYTLSGYVVPSGNYATVEQGHNLWAASGNLQTSGDYTTKTEVQANYLRLDTSNDPLTGELDVSGTVWIRSGDGQETVHLRLGNFIGLPNSAAYEFATDDATGDFLYIDSRRFAHQTRFRRNSSGGTRNVAEIFSSPITGSRLQLWGDDQDNTIGIQLRVGGHTYFNSGNVGIGLTSPSELLSIQGNVKLEAAGNKYIGFNNDSIELKFVDFYTSTANQFGQGQLFNELWFGAINGNPTKRIGFYLEIPNKGAPDAAGGGGIQATNDKMAIHTSGVDIADTLYVTGDVNTEGALRYQTQDTDDRYAFSGNLAPSGNYATVDQGHILWQASGSYATSGDYATVTQGHNLWLGSGLYAVSGDYATVSQGHELWKSDADFFQPSGFQVPSGNYATVTQGHQLWQASGNYQTSGDYTTKSEVQANYLRLDTSNDPLTDTLTIDRSSGNQLKLTRAGAPNDANFSMTAGGTLNIGSEGGFSLLSSGIPIVAQRTFGITGGMTVFTVKAQRPAALAQAQNAVIFSMQDTNDAGTLRTVAQFKAIMNDPTAGAVSSSFSLLATSGNVSRDILRLKGLEGRVGILDTTPSYTLDVGGDINTQAVLRIGGEDTDDRYKSALQLTALIGTMVSGQLISFDGTEFKAVDP